MKGQQFLLSTASTSSPFSMADLCCSCKSTQSIIYSLKHILLAAPIAQANLTHFLSQLPPPFILHEDFNTTNILWVSALTDEIGRMVTDIYALLNLIVLNMGANMHLSLDRIRVLICSRLHILRFMLSSPSSIACFS
jgi:hypothetical protein